MNVGFHTELLLNEKPLYNVLLVLNNMLHHVTSSFNTKLLKFVLSDNSNVWVLFKLILKLMFNNMVHHFWTLKHSFNKLVLPVLLKILCV